MNIQLFKTIWPAIIWSALIFVLLSLPGSELPEAPHFPLFDKMIHVFLFGTHVYLWNRYLAPRAGSDRRVWVFFLTFLISSLYGIGMEYYQKYFVPNRGYETGDMIADITGALIGWWISKKAGSDT